MDLKALKIGAFTEQNYKNWKQFTTDGALYIISERVLLLNKITKIESNSQHILQAIDSINGAFTEQNYKNWKQFTTATCCSSQHSRVLLLNKITKIESNSQQVLEPPTALLRCFYWTKIQNLKAILNSYCLQGAAFDGAFTEQRYKIWKQFSTYGGKYLRPH